MKILTGSRGDEVHEHLYENGQRLVGHRILKKNTVTNNGEFHPVPGNIVLIPLKGTVKLTTPDQECTIKNGQLAILGPTEDRKSTRLNSSHVSISYAVFCLKKKRKTNISWIYRKHKFAKPHDDLTMARWIPVLRNLSSHIHMGATFCWCISSRASTT